MIGRPDILDGFITKDTGSFLLGAAMGMGKSFNVDTSAKEANTARNCCRTDKPFVFFRFRSAQLMVDMNDAQTQMPAALKPLE